MIFGPMDHVGCASASSTLTDSSSSREWFLNGPPDAVSIDRLDGVRGVPVEALEERGVLAVDRQERASPLPPGRQCEVAGGDEALLVRQGERDSVLERPERRADACEADDGVEHEVGLAASRTCVRSPPTWTCSTPRSDASSSSGCDPDASAHTVSSGFAATTSSACRPMDPVAPSRAIRLSRTREG